MHHAPLITTLAVAFVLAFSFGSLANCLRISPIVGYLLAGLVVGPNTPGFVADLGLAKQLAEIGVILLMFGVGLHFSFQDLLAVRKISIPGALTQITAATVLGLAFGLFMGWTPAAGIIFGLTLSVASTVVLLRSLEERNLTASRRGQIAIGWLVIEDIAMIVALVVLPTAAAMLQPNASGVSVTYWDLAAELGVTALKVSIFVTVMLVAGRQAIPWLLNRVALTGSRELFTLAILAIALGIAYAAAELGGASFALGAFFAGMVLAGSPLSQNAAERSLPLRDAFAVLFFVSVGMLFDPAILQNQPLALLVVIFIIVIGKSIAAFVIVRVYGYSNATAATVAISLAQVGEFSFILGGMAFELKILPKEAYDLLLGGAIFSIMLNPALFYLLDRFELRLNGGEAAQPDEPLVTPVAYDLRDHVIVAGYGRVGRRIAETLQSKDEVFVVIDAESDRIDLMGRHNVRAVPGRADRPETLLAAGIKHARVLLVAIPNGFDAGAVVAAAKALNPGIAIVARASFEAEVEHLRAYGAQTVLLAERELADRMVEFSPRPA